MLLWLLRMRYFWEHLLVSVLKKSSHSKNWQIYRKISISVCLWSLLLKTKEGRIRSSHQRCSVSKGVPKNFIKFTAKHPCQSLRSGPATVLKNKNWHRSSSSCEFYETSKNTFFIEHLRLTGFEESAMHFTF